MRHRNRDYDRNRKADRSTFQKEHGFKKWDSSFELMFKQRREVK